MGLFLDRRTYQSMEIARCISFGYSELVIEDFIIF